MYIHGAPAPSHFMPSFFPENDTVSPGDDKWRVLQKWAHLLFVANGNRPCPMFPEGSEPLVGDNEHRLQMKINALRS